MAQGTPLTIDVLAAAWVWASEGEGPSEIARRLGVSKQGISRRLRDGRAEAAADQLEADGRLDAVVAELDSDKAKPEPVMQLVGGFNDIDDPAVFAAILHRAGHSGMPFIVCAVREGVSRADAQRWRAEVEAAARQGLRTPATVRWHLFDQARTFNAELLMRRAEKGASGWQIAWRMLEKLHPGLFETIGEQTGGVSLDEFSTEELLRIIGGDDA